MLLWALGVFLLRRPECIFSKCWDPRPCFLWICGKRKKKKRKRLEGQTTRYKCSARSAYVCGIGGRRQVVIGLDNNRKSTFFCPRISIKVTAGGWQYGKAYAPLLSSNWPSNEESLIRNPRSIRPSSSALGAPVNLVQSANQPISQSASLSRSSLSTSKRKEKKNTHPTSFLPSNPDKYPISKIILSTGNPVNTLLITTVILFNLPSLISWPTFAITCEMYDRTVGCRDW